MRRWLFLATALALALMPSAPAFARGFSLPNARVEVVVTPTGALEVAEHITYRFDGSFRGGYRDIPLRSGEQISGVAVSEGGVAYTPGAPTELGSSGAPGTFGTTRHGDSLRVVWHYDAAYEERTFTIGYRITGLVTVHDDVADLNLRVWGDEWEAELQQLEATIVLPSGAPGQLRVWGHPETIEGFTNLNERGRKATLRAIDVPPGRWVEMRLLFPPRLLTSTIDAQVRSGEAFGKIVSGQLDAALEADREERRLRWLRANAPWLIPAAAILGLLPGIATAAWLYRRFGKEPVVLSQPQHLHEPPDDEAPALVRALLETGHAKATGDAFTATLFDLIRRGYIDAMATTTIKKTWAGLKREELSDLSIARTSKPDGDLRGFEDEVVKAIAKASAGEERLLLSEIKDRIQEEPEYYQERFTRFKEEIGDELRHHGWWSSAGLQPTISACAAFAVAAGLFIFAAMSKFGGPDGVTYSSVILLGIGVLLALNGIGLVFFALYRRGWERRSPEAAEAASRWAAFRRFLEDFEGIPQAVPGSIAIWEQYLCYGIAFGVADRVLEAAQLYAPAELDSQSKVFWIDPHGPLGMGRSAFAISDLSHSVASAAPHSTGRGFLSGGGGFGGGGFGGGFSGGGGSGGGGGGGGAW